jgi:nitroimidazol reductase NimA-like FMN-containing flavoprotein (pyridoxamine 5'-phosphate oxidase superfamily)
MTSLSPTPRTTVQRGKKRAVTERTALTEILAESIACTVAVTTEHGPIAMPLAFGTDGNTLYLHGSTGAHWLRAAVDRPVCVTATLLDGLVFARSSFNASANYRAAVILGEGRLVTDDAERLRGLAAVSDHVAPGYWDYSRQPTKKELAATAVLALDLTEASVKIRSGGPMDDESDVAEGTRWAGVLPIRTVFGEAISVTPEIAMPSVLKFD